MYIIDISVTFALLSLLYCHLRLLKAMILWPVKHCKTVNVLVWLLQLSKFYCWMTSGYCYLIAFQNMYTYLTILNYYYYYCFNYYFAGYHWHWDNGYLQSTDSFITQCVKDPDNQSNLLLQVQCITSRKLMNSSL